MTSLAGMLTTPLRVGAWGLLGLALLTSGCVSRSRTQSPLAVGTPGPADLSSPSPSPTPASDGPSPSVADTTDPSPTALNAATAEEAYGMALAAWSHGALEDAESTIQAAVQQFPDDQRLLLFQAACLRSAGRMDEAYRIFYRIYELAPGTPEGRCALSMIYLDTHKQEDNVHFTALRNLVVREQPDDVLLRWMLATQCANYSVDFADATPQTRLSLAQEGATHFRHIFKQVKAAPIPLHQTMSDVLAYLGRHDEARRHLRMAQRREADDL